MFLGFLQFIVGTAASLFGMLLLLRAWTYVWALSPRHPFVQLTRRATDWLVEPLSRVVMRKGSYDLPSLLGAFLTALLAVAAEFLLRGGYPSTLGLVAAPFALVCRWALEMVSWGTLIWALLSWLNPRSPVTYTLETLLEPVVRPIRRMIPTTIGRFDFAPLIVLVIANVLLTLILPVSHGFVMY